jgi:chromosome segregation ATPase
LLGFLQAKTTQKELTATQSQVEEISSRNIIILAELEECRRENSQVNALVQERNKKLSDSASRMSDIVKAKEELDHTHEATVAELSQLRSQLQQAKQALNTSSLEKQESKTLCVTLEKDLQSTREEMNGLKRINTKSAQRIAELEKEKSQLRDKLNTTIGVLEQKAAKTIETTTAR